MIFFTSDWHVGHENALYFDERPFKDLDEMHTQLIKRYNATVPENGLCYFLGDMGAKLPVLESVVRQLHGTKVMLWGNHDKSFESLYRCGFDVVLYTASISIRGHVVTLSHCPLRNTYREDLSHIDPNSTEPWHGHNRPKHKLCSVANEGQFCCHGHVHSRPGKTTCEQRLGRQFDVGVCGNNYYPYSIKQIDRWIVSVIRHEDSH